MSFRRGSLQKGKRHQTAGAENTDNGPNHVGPRGIVAVRRFRFVSDRHFWAPACCLRSIGRAPLRRLCSIVLRWVGNEPLRHLSARFACGRPKPVLVVPTLCRPKLEANTRYAAIAGGPVGTPSLHLLEPAAWPALWVRADLIPARATCGWQPWRDPPSPWGRDGRERGSAPQ